MSSAWYADASVLGRPVAQHRTAALVANAVGAIGAVTAWVGARGELQVDQQISWANLAVAAAVVAALGDAWWILISRRLVAERRRQVAADLAPVISWLLPAVNPSAGVLVAVPGTERFHLDTCMFVSGKPTRSGTQAEHEAARRRRCELCLS